MAGILDGKVVLITGGTGSFGRTFVDMVLSRFRVTRLVVFSRDEHKQNELSRSLGPDGHRSVRFVIGDVRDRDAVRRAFDGVDIVVHAAALKHIPTAERNPLEVVKTNILGAANVIDAALERGLEKVIAISSDKAANPINLYGATKLCADKLFLAADDPGATRFGVVRYGNVLGSRGSVVPLFMELRSTGVLPVTDQRMTRFWITVSQGVEFTISCIARMHGGEVFVPKIPSMSVVDLARAIGPDCDTPTVGVRPGEKLHEVLISADDARRTVEYDDRYVILPVGAGANGAAARNGGRPCPDDFAYSSDRNPRWLTVGELRSLLDAMR